MLMLLSLLFGCNPKMDEATVKGVVEKAFLEQNSTAGRYGWELIGKGQWFVGNEFDMECLMENELAYVNYNKPGQITPSYGAQHSLTASSKKGYCIDMGSDLSYTVNSIEHVSETGSMDVQMVNLTFELKNAAPWVSCLKEDVMTRMVRAQNLSGTPELHPDDIAKMAFQEGNGCPNPVRATADRISTPKPESKPDKKPTLDDVKALAQKFDDALFNGDLDAAYAMLSCVNLFEKTVWGTCSQSDLLAVGPSTHGDERMESPWMEYTQYNFDALKKVVADKTDATLFHVLMPHRKNKSTRSFSVQWAEGRWKLFGVVSIQGAGLTPIRLMNDLHDKQYRKAFEQRLAGEEVDYKGNPLNPNAEDEE